MNRIPTELRPLARWVCWRYEDTGRAKPAKVPCSTGGYHTNVAHKRHATYTDVVNAFTARPDYFSGIGFVFVASDGYTGIDFDNCLDEHGAFCNPWAEAWVRRLNSYSEVSPSGRGVKVIVRGRIPRALKQAQIEIYNSARFFTITGRLLAGAPNTIRDAQAELDELFSALRPSTTDVDTTLPPAILADAEIQAELDTFAGLLDSEQIPRCLTDRSQGRAVLRAALAGWPEGAPDYSVERYKLMASLAMHGYSDAQIAAALWYYRPVLNGGGKTIANWGADIARVIGKVRAAHPDWKPTPKGRMVAVTTRPIEAPAPPVKSRARTDRPQKVAGANGYLEWLKTQTDAHTSMVMLSQSECAERLKVSLSTIKRYEKALGDQIERRAYAQRQAGCICLLDADRRSVNIPVQEPVQPEPVLPQPNAPNNVDTTINAMERHTGSLAPCPDLVRRALDVAGLNPATGELRSVRFPTVARYVEQHAPGRFSRERIHRTYKTVLLERARAREQARLQALPRKQLEGRLRWCDRLLEKPDQPKAAMARVQRAQILAELERREREQVLVATHPLEVFAVGPAPGGRNDETLFDVIDRAERPPVTRRAVKTPVCPSQPPKPEHSANVYAIAAQGIAGRLRNLKQAAAPG